MAATALPASTPVRFTKAGDPPVPVVPLPNWPASLYPQATKLPSVHRARLEFMPAATVLIALPSSTPFISTGTGTMLLLDPLIPS